MELLYEIQFDGDTYKLKLLDNGRYEYICEKNKRGFKTTFRSVDSEEGYIDSVNAMKNFIVNNDLL